MQEGLVLDNFRNAMAPIASSVTIVTTDGRFGPAGVTVSTMCSLSLEPPSLIFCVHHQSKALQPILNNRVFAANALADDQQSVAEAFAGRIEKYRRDRFACATWMELATGAPILTDALASFDCRLANHTTFGSHVVLIGEVVDLVSNNASPLIYADRNFHKLIAA